MQLSCSFRKNFRAQTPDSLQLVHNRTISARKGVVVKIGLAGIAWIAMLSTLNVAAQMALPNWVKARVLAVNLVVFNGGMAGGSALWGATATRFGIPLALTIAAIGQLLALWPTGGA